MTSNPVISWFAGIDARIWQAVIAGGFVAAGWLFNGWQNRRDAARLRREKLRDMHRAIFAEIGVYTANIWDEDALNAFANEMVERMEKNADFVPFIPHERGDVVFNAMIPDVHILPRQTIDPIVAYYSQLATISAFIEDMRGDAFRQMMQTRRIAMYRDYIEMKKQALQFGRFANEIINAFGKGGATAAETMADKLNTRATGPSDQSRGSV